LDPVSKFSGTSEKPGYVVEFADNVGDALTFKILKNELVPFPLHDAILFQGHGKSQAQDLQLAVLECKVYHSVLMNTKSQIDFDRLLQLHMLDQTEEDNNFFKNFPNYLNFLLMSPLSSDAWRPI
jgi:hypothetical protein